MIFIGIDPGLKGGLAAIRADRTVVCYIPMPCMKVLSDFTAALDQFFAAAQNADPGFGFSCGTVVAIEKVGGRPGDGARAAFSFGFGLGLLSMYLSKAGLRTVQPSPQTWKKEVLRDLPHDKEGAITFCAQNWPLLTLVQPRCRTPHDGIADALCIAEWARRNERKQT